jgi:hypothetical protein
MTFFRHRLIGHGVGGEEWVTSLHSSSTGTLADAHAAWNTFCVGMFTGELAARYSTLVGMSTTVTDALDATTGKNTAQIRTDAAHAGTATDGVQSSRACLLVALRTALPTRKGRGRMFWPAPTAASIDTDGAVKSAALTAIAADFGTQLTTLAGAVTPIIFHRPKPLLFIDGTGTPVIAVAINGQLATQRRRNNKTVNPRVSATV